MTATTARPPEPFSWLPEAHPLRGALEAPAVEMAAHAVEWAARCAADGSRAVLHHELSVAEGAGGWELRRVAASHQAWPVDGPFQFAAASYLWRDDARGGTAGTWFRYPDEPYLATLPEFGAGLAGRTDVALLRYVPMRRFTVRIGQAGPLGSGGGDATVVKLKRRSRAAESHARVGAVTALLADGRHGVVAPALVGHDADACTYSQVHVAAPDLASLAPGLGVERAGRILGDVAAALHGVHPDPARSALARSIVDPGAVARDTASSARWLALALPELAPVLDRVAALLATRRPEPARRPTLVHGDLACSHVLVGDGMPTVIDLDLAAVGDPIADLARALVLARRDVPVLLAEAAAGRTDHHAELSGAALDAHAAVHGSIRDADVAWHRAVAEIAELRVHIDKDHPAQLVAGAVALSLEECCRAMSRAPRTHGAGTNRVEAA